MSSTQSTWRPGKPCAICGDWHGEIRSCRDNLAVIRCKICGLYYVDAAPNPNRESENQLASEQGPRYLREVYHRENDRWIRYYRTRLRHIGALTSGRRLLDIGCGIGQLIRAACDSGWDAYGIDTSADTVMFGIESLGLRGRLEATSLEESRFSGKEFDVVTLFSVIEHVSDPRALLTRVNAILGPGGLVVVKTPSQSSLITRVYWLFLKVTRCKVDLGLYNREHIYRFSPSTLETLLKKTGFQLKFVSFDDQLWITARRYLSSRRFKSARFVALAIIHGLAKIFGMQNQLIMIAEKMPVHQGTYGGSLCP